MVLITQTSSGAQYLYFQAGPKSLYIASKGDPSKAKLENVVRAVKYVQERIKYNNESQTSFCGSCHPRNGNGMQGGWL